ncbi:fumarate reductase flavoprotein subunit [Lactobacillus bombicola]|uniref:Fumarate reductase flavoprotein subunit n=1 Tax=Lactobacillus bombicola TaxID=1505723 RepID=A0A1I1RT51_9LACO|nr:FAD-dependent oxidoreductase [Lactobacillus bombicola]SFD37237.1 fumarate reductase flavoprotein subunit [Lactobacillus bombicola]
MEDYDVVIVGAGLAGFAAAAEAGDQGLKTLLVEKGKTTGGTGNYVEGVFAADSVIQKQENAVIDKKELLQEELTYSHYRADGRMWQKYIDQAGTNVSWLEERGAKIAMVANLGAGARTWHLFAGKGHDAIHNGLEPYAKEKGVKLVTQTRVIDLKQETDNSYEVTLLQMIDEKERVVKAKNVVLATGGYLNDQELLANTAHQNPQNIIPVNSGKNTGDGLRLAWNLGAKKFFTGMAMMFGGQLKDPTIPAYKLWGTAIWSSVCDQPQCWVNEMGERFVDESAAVVNWANEGNAMNRQERIFCIFSQKILDDFTDRSYPRSMKPFVPEDRYPTLRDDIEQAEKDGREYLHKANTLEELAEEIDTPNLVSYVKHYNEMAANGEDTDFHKPTKYLLPVDGNGPFYAIELGVGAYTTGDGLRVNVNNQVLDTEGRLISGLYAIGGDGSAVLYGDTYGVNVPGTHAGYCIFSGRNAIQSIVNK